MQETTSYVTYYVATQHRPGIRPALHSEGQGSGPKETNTVGHQQQAIQDFFSTKQSSAERSGGFVETPDSRRTAKWPELHKALELCKERQATLLIAELGTLTSNEIFAKMLLDSGVKFHCLDQPFVNQTILEALSKHAEVQRKLHGKLIREGLKMTSAKSGNPNAAEVISKVNKPKIDTAIVFAMLLQPIILDYRRKGYSQRQMVKTLNDEGFTAPEGGKWVLSQLQKVLDRVRLNEVALEVKPFLKVNTHETLSQIAETLNAKGIAAIKRGPWDESQVKKLVDRMKQIDEIEVMNRFVLHLLPLLHEFQSKGLTAREMLKELEAAGLTVRGETEDKEAMKEAMVA